MLAIVSLPLFDFGTIWWKCSISRCLHSRHLPCCCSRTACFSPPVPNNAPCRKSISKCILSGSVSSMKANLFTSTATSVTGSIRLIRSNRFRCVLNSWVAVGVSQPSGLSRLLNLASVLMISFTANGSLHPGSSLSFKFFAVVPSFFASLFRARRSPRLEARLCARRSVINFGISLFLVSQWARKSSVPSERVAARPMFVRPGSCPTDTGCKIPAVR